MPANNGIVQNFCDTKLKPNLKALKFSPFYRDSYPVNAKKLPRSASTSNAY